jgi:toxin ParE1/3/4
LRIVWSRRALLNVNAIAAYLDERDPGAATRTLDAIARGVCRLVFHPLSGRIGRVEGTREVVIPRTPYIVAYRMRGDSLEILAVIHGARRWPERL